MKEIQIVHQKLTIHELDDVCDSATGRALTGSWLWNSALMLAEWLATQSQLHHFDFHSKSVIELGAGTGLPGLTAALLGASRVVLTDVELLLPGLLRNVEANGLGDRLEVRELVWKSKDSASETKGLDKFDVVLMSDVFFDQDEMGPLADTTKRLCRRDTKIWGAAEVRPWTCECLNEFTSRGFEVVELAIQLVLPILPWEKENQRFSPFSTSHHHTKKTRRWIIEFWVFPLWNFTGIDSALRKIKILNYPSELFLSANSGSTSFKFGLEIGGVRQASAVVQRRGDARELQQQATVVGPPL